MSKSVTRALFTLAESLSSAIPSSPTPSHPPSHILLAYGSPGNLGLNPGKTTHEKLWTTGSATLSCSLTAYLQSYLINHESKWHHYHLFQSDETEASEWNLELALWAGEVCSQPGTLPPSSVEGTPHRVIGFATVLTFVCWSATYYASQVGL